MAGVEGFEPPNGGIKTRCLTTWRHPNADRLFSSTRARRPRTIQTRHCRGSCLQAAVQQPAASRRARTHRRPCRSAARPAAPACRAPLPPADNGSRTTGSQSLRPPSGGSARILRGGVSRVNSGALNTSRVDTATCGCTIRNQRAGSSMGVSTSPRPAAKALRPCTNTGTSEPSASPSCRQPCQRPVQPPQLVQRQQHGGGIGTAAAQAATGRNALAHMDAGAQLRAARLLQQARGAHGQVVAHPPALPAADQWAADRARSGHRRERRSSSSSQRSTSWNTVSRS